jgi:hypothetical protein
LQARNRPEATLPGDLLVGHCFSPLSQQQLQGINLQLAFMLIDNQAQNRVWYPSGYNSTHAGV